MLSPAQTEAISEKNPFEYLPVEDVCPAEPRKKYEYIQKLGETGLSLKAALLTYSHGNNKRHCDM